MRWLWGEKVWSTPGNSNGNTISADRGAAVDDDGLPGGETSRRRGQKYRGPCDFVGLADAQKRRARGGGLQGFRIVPQRLGKIGLDQARRDAVDADIVRSVFAGQIARELHVG